MSLPLPLAERTEPCLPAATATAVPTLLLLPLLPLAECSFSRDQLSLIDRGWTVAIAHIRGGGDMGRKWYEVSVRVQGSGFRVKTLNPEFETSQVDTKNIPLQVIEGEYESCSFEKPLFPQGGLIQAARTCSKSL